MWIMDPEGWLTNMDAYERIGVQGNCIVAQEAAAGETQRSGAALLHRHALILVATTSNLEAQEVLKAIRAALQSGAGFFDSQQFLAMLRAKAPAASRGLSPPLGTRTPSLNPPPPAAGTLGGKAHQL